MLSPPLQIPDATSAVLNPASEVVQNQQILCIISKSCALSANLGTAPDGEQLKLFVPAALLIEKRTYLTLFIILVPHINQFDSGF